MTPLAEQPTRLSPLSLHGGQSYFKHRRLLGVLYRQLATCETAVRTLLFTEPPPIQQLAFKRRCLLGVLHR